MKLLKNKHWKSYQNSKICYIYKEKLENKHAQDIRYCKTKDHWHCTGENRGAAYSICNFKNSITEENTIVFHNESNYDYYFIIKGLAEEFEGQFIVFEKILKNA